MSLGNVREWFMWALFEMSPEQFDKSDKQEELNVELNAYIDATENRVSRFRLKFRKLKILR